MDDATITSQFFTSAASDSVSPHAAALLLDPSVAQTLGFRFLEMAMLCPSLLRKEMGDLVLDMSAAFSSGLKLWLSEHQK